MDELWDRIDAFLKSRLNPETYGRWFAPLRPAALGDGRLQVVAPDKFHRDFVDDNYRGFLDEVIAAIAQGPLQLTLAVDDRPRPSGQNGVARPAPTPIPAAATPAEGSADLREGRPNPRYLFETFVVGESNRFAFSAAEGVARKPGQQFNPLFLHGDSGLGKTHLLHAVANAIQAGRPDGRVVLVSSERYTNDFVDALRKGGLDEFRRKYRGCAALLVDDVQFLAGKEKTAEEFFHTFNALYEQNVQIVLSSDRSPKELKGLEERLCSRFEWGMRVAIQPPDFETRAAILQRKAETEQFELPDDVCKLLAHYIRSNVRELHGALMKLGAIASFKREAITEQLAREVLSDIIPPPGQKRTIEQVQEAVAGRYGLTIAKLTSSNREKKVALPRQVAMYLCRELTGETLQAIAEKFNKKDHTTVMAACERIAQLVEIDPSVRTAVAAIREQLSP